MCTLKMFGILIFHFNAEGSGTALCLASFALLSSGLLIEMPDTYDGTQTPHFQTESENQ